MSIRDIDAKHWERTEEEIVRESARLYDKHGCNMKVVTSLYVMCPTGSFRVVAEPEDKMVVKSKKETLWCDVGRNHG
jgi:hypothetical protein